MVSRLQISRGFLTKEETGLLLDTTTDMMERLTWLCMMDLGLRLAETQRPTLADLQSPHIHLQGKGSLWRHLPTTARLRETAKALTRNPYHYTPEDHIPFRPRTIQSRFHKALTRANIRRPHLSCHSLRHTYACTLIDAGIPIHDVQALMGHANLTTTSAYLHVAPGHLARTAEQLDLYNGEPHVHPTTPNP